MAIIREALLSGLTAVSFGFLYQVAGKTLWIAGLIGTVSWFTGALFGRIPGSSLLSDLVGAFLIGMLAEFFASRRKEPSSMYIVPAIIAFVPGYQVYLSMVAFVKGQFTNGLQAGLTAVMAAGALSIGLALATAIFRPLLRKRYRPFVEK